MHDLHPLGADEPNQYADATFNIMNRLDDAAVAALAFGRFTGLRRLTMNGRQMTDAGILQLSRLRCLSRLSLGHCPLVTEVGCTVSNIEIVTQEF